ncbi:hypothetical protein GE21DRAFT_1311056 [Neurospora crassa]|uniref:Uncharacterized protein n=2 Tax=Neurospora TaxID=5140 RepID=A0AAJ0I7W2_9PEZI|nr:hypothetical protein NEUTE2DRAFT_117856 [Neurospora tetrasperma FGSC 2509]KAK3492594.1 hypothetical protein B0T23DRAFT_317695 [Neurospora hispaniola]KHE81633.1 hypothetical protein GE21DRAFT_1311056 [Neurospora crassa]
MRVQIPTPGYTAYMKLPAVPANIQAALAGDENQRLNLIWIGLVAVEILMVVSVVLHAVIRTVYPKKKQRLGSW